MEGHFMTGPCVKLTIYYYSSCNSLLAHCYLEHKVFQLLLGASKTLANSCGHSVSILDPNHVNTAVRFQESGLSNHIQTENCIQCQIKAKPLVQTS